MSTCEINKQEFFDPNAMKQLICHQGLASQVKTQLKKYFKRRVNGNCVPVCYQFAKNCDGIGRVYPQNAMGLQCFQRDIRNALASDIYFDVDMENAQPRILLRICQQHGWTCTTLQQYIELRDPTLVNIMEHYHVSRSVAKELMNRLMFGGTIDAWISENTTTPLPQPTFLKQFQEELNAIARNMWNQYTNIVDIVNKRRKTTPQEKIASCMAYVLQTEEHKILMAIDACLKSLGRHMDVFIFDGGLVRRNPNEQQLPPEILRLCEKHVKNTLGYEILLVIKPMETSLVLQNPSVNTVDSHIKINDAFAAKAFVKAMEGKLVYCENSLWVFCDETGMWTDDKIAIRRNVNKHTNELTFHQMDAESGKERIFDYAGTERNITNMLKNVPALCKADEAFFEDRADTSIGKLLFSDGIYDFDSDTFTPGFDSTITFKHRIRRPFPKHRDESLVNHVRKVLFEDTFLKEDRAASDYLRIGISRALYGDYKAKLFYFCVGRSNAGKGVLTDALIAAFHGFIGTFNANSLSYNDKNGGDSAKQLSWVIDNKDKRITISNEVSMHRPFDGNMIKMLASGGDRCDARKNYQDEIKIVNRSTMFCFVNDIPNISPNDDAVSNRVRCIEYKCVFVDGEITRDYERMADKTIKTKFASDSSYQDALVHVMLDAYKEYKQGGHAVPDGVKEATREWSGNAGSVEAMLLKRYEITRDPDDFVSSREILDFLQKDEKINMSDKKIGMELKSLGLNSKQRKVHGKNTKGWDGLKECLLEV